MKKFTLPLCYHPTTPVSWIQNVTVNCSYNSDGMNLMYQINGNIELLQLPTHCSSPHRADNLWQHTCGEAFVAQKNTTIYREWNFSPSRQWQVYEFADYREARTLPAVSAPQIYSIVTPEQFTLTVQIPSTWYPHNTPLLLGLSMILQDVTGKISYWALQHSPGLADFHIDKNWMRLE